MKASAVLTAYIATAHEAQANAKQLQKLADGNHYRDIHNPRNNRRGKKGKK